MWDPLGLIYKEKVEITVEPLFYRLSDLMLLLGVSRSQLHKIRTGDESFPKPIVMGGARCLRWRKQSIDRWAERKARRAGAIREIDRAAKKRRVASELRGGK